MDEWSDEAMDSRCMCIHIFVKDIGHKFWNMVGIQKVYNRESMVGHLNFSLLNKCLI